MTPTTTVATGTTPSMGMVAGPTGELIGTGTTTGEDTGTTGATGTGSSSGEQLKFDFSVKKIEQANNDDLIWYDTFTNTVMVNQAHKMYDILIKSLNEIK